MKMGDIKGDRILLSDPFMKFNGSRKIRMVTVKCKCGSINDVQASSFQKCKTGVCKQCFLLKRRTNITDKKSGLLIANKFIGHHGKYHSQWEINCKCGKKCYMTAYEFLGGKRTTCGCGTDRLHKNNRCWKGYGEIPGQYWGGLASRAKRRNQSFEISIIQAWRVFLKQNRKCALSGKDIYFCNNSKNIKGTASLDRINSSKDYIKDNIQWVHKDINTMKMHFDQNYFIQTCKEIAKNHDRFINQFNK